MDNAVIHLQSSSIGSSFSRGSVTATSAQNVSDSGVLRVKKPILDRAVFVDGGRLGTLRQLEASFRRFHRRFRRFRSAVSSSAEARQAAGSAHLEQQGS